MPQYSYAPSIEAYILQHWLFEKSAAAHNVEATRWNRDWFWFGLAGPHGNAKVTISRGSEIRLEFNIPTFFENTINLEFVADRVTVQGNVSMKYLEYSIDAIVPTIMSMEITPCAFVPYGLVYEDTIVGIVFSPDAPLNQDQLNIFMVDDFSAAFPFINVPDPAERLRQFWETLNWGTNAEPKILDLTTLLKTEPIHVVVGGGRTFPEVWLRFDASYNEMVRLVESTYHFRHGRIPPYQGKTYSNPKEPWSYDLTRLPDTLLYLVIGAKYKAWDGAAKTFSTQALRPPEDELMKWFSSY